MRAALLSLSPLAGVGVCMSVAVGGVLAGTVALDWGGVCGWGAPCCACCIVGYTRLAKTHCYIMLESQPAPSLPLGGRTTSLQSAVLTFASPDPSVGQ